MSQPHAYQYRYQATPSSFLAGARGDLDGDGRLSDFTLEGEVMSSRLVVSPTISETDPEERRPRLHALGAAAGAH